MANENTVVKKPSTTIGVDKYTFFKVDQGLSLIHI